MNLTEKEFVKFLSKFDEHPFDVKIGDEVTLVGKDGDEMITMEEIGDLSGRFNYEFVCVLGKRVPRVFYKNGVPVESQEYFE